MEKIISLDNVKIKIGGGLLLKNNPSFFHTLNIGNKSPMFLCVKKKEG